MKLRLHNFLSRRLRFWGDIPFRTRVVILGVSLTTAVLAMEATGYLRPLEGWLYDTRAKRCQFFSPRPTTQLVHMDIDDSALETYGGWPWKRGRRIIGRVVDELREAGAEALALDITFEDDEGRNTDAEDEGPGATTAPTTAPTSLAGTYPVSVPASPATAPTGNGGGGGTMSGVNAALDAIRRQDDAALAAAVERFGRVVLPTNFDIRLEQETELERVVREQLRLNLETTVDEMAEWLKRFGGRKLRSVDRDVLIDAVVRGRKQVVLEKLTVAPNQPLDELLPREMRGANRSVRSPLQDLVEKKRAQARSVLAMDRLYFREVPSELSNLLVTEAQNPPIESLTEALARAKAMPTGAAGMIGSVNYANQALSPDGVVRSVPLLVNDRGHLLPQFGLALACAVLGVDPTNREEFTVTPDQVVLSPAGKEPIVIPVFTEAARGRVPTIGACFAIPWFGGRDWKTMYDWPRHADVVNHVPFMLAATIGKKRADLRFNEGNRVKANDDIALLRKFGGLPEPGPSMPFTAVLDETMKAAEFGINDLRKVPPAERQPDEVLMLKAADAVAGLRSNAEQLKRELELAKAKLRRAVEGKVVIMGWAASGQTDSVPTSLHGQCPGSVVHGVIYNAIMTRNLWTRAPTWLPYLIAILFGGLMTWAVAKLTPSGSTAVAVVLAASYAAFNGILVFDRWNVILGAAAPLSAIGLVWAGCTAASAGERFRINQMLHGYVDPKLVNYLNLHPENELFETKSQEVTVCFSDIQGFTTMTQQLGEKMIPLLQEYLSRMVAVIRRHGGVVNKFMGDGIMFIFGVPEREVAAIHAEEALRCCLEMQEALTKFNEERVPDGFPPLKMRCGVNTGMAYVGDAGPAEAREYTALGDTTNLAARLEPANKEFDTRILVTEATFLQTLNSFVFIPVGKLQVRGRKEGTMTYELLCRVDDGDDECRHRAEAMQAMILSYQQGVFDGCLKLIAQFETRFGENRICKVYRELCLRYAEDGAPGDFHGQVRIG